jgi:hypothetical protein
MVHDTNTGDLDFVHRSDLNNLNTTFRKLDLSPSPDESGGGGAYSVASLRKN